MVTFANAAQTSLIHKQVHSDLQTWSADSLKRSYDKKENKRKSVLFMNQALFQDFQWMHFRFFLRHKTTEFKLFRVQKTWNMTYVLYGSLLLLLLCFFHRQFIVKSDWYIFNPSLFLEWHNLSFCDDKEWKTRRLTVIFDSYTLKSTIDW